MKVSIESILGSARRIAGQREPREESRDSGKNEVRSDTVSIEGRINTRISTIQSELKDIQSSLTRNQVINDGILQLRDDTARGGQNLGDILDNVRFEGQTVLRSFVGDRISTDVLDSGQERIERRMGDDVTKLRRLQVEAENMMASGTGVGDRIDGIMGSIESSLAGRDGAALRNLTSLNPDTVRRLVR